MQLQYVGPEAAEDISAIAHRIFPEVYPWEPKEILEEFLDEVQSPEAIREQMANGMRYAYILDGGERAGYAAYGMDGDRMFFSKLYLFDGFRGRGLGSQVLQVVEDEARGLGARSVYLDVNGRNTGAMALYARRGYVKGEVVGRRYLRVLMEKPLRSEK